MHIVYVLRSVRDGRLYTGSTGDLKRRLKEHNAGKTASTKWRRPFVVIYTEEFSTRQEAESRERYLKTGKGRGELKQLLEGLKPIEGGSVLEARSDRRFKENRYRFWRGTAPAEGGQEW